MTIAIAVAIPGLLLQASERIADGAWITRAEARRLAEERGYELSEDD